MSMGQMPYCVDPVDFDFCIVNTGWAAMPSRGPLYRLLFWPDGGVGFEHTCDRGVRGMLVCAPRLAAHDVTGPREHPTVTPSILCPDCGTHGFITEGRWVDA